MYQSKPLSPLISDKCFACKFCVWDDERHEEGCEIHGCFNCEKFIEYKGTDDKNDKH